VALLEQMTSDTEMRVSAHQSKPIYISYFFLAATIFLVGALHLATPLLTVLFCYFALHKLHFTRSKALTIIMFSVVVGLGFYAFALFVKSALRDLPDIADKSIPRIVDYAEKNKIEIPFDDVDSLKSTVRDNLKEHSASLANFAKLATKEFVFLLIGIVVAASLFLNPAMDLERGHRLRNNLYTLSCEQIVLRFQSFYASFENVMGAQIIIAFINTAFTAIFILGLNLPVFGVNFPHAPIVIGVTFLCGLLPIIGNIISNSLITGIAFTISPQLAISALVFLIVLHKFEYFLNSKIVGARIKNPVWLTLLGIILGERLMGVPGIILAPVVLHFIKVESSLVEVRQGRTRVISTIPEEENSPV
jgi:predicted PurR-regulated permease PerM